MEDEGPGRCHGAARSLDLSRFDRDLLPGTWREARTGPGIKNAERSHMILHRAPDTGLHLALYVRDEYGSVHMGTDDRGEATARHPRKSVKPGR
ncbi:hypothetical protein ACGF8B_05015 [Streptomyces sp. NPDC047917]|uniref:hypothetical protein n=1 Tax=Streptomyces sp. NPDC047917 TaxID=3365491 RepID=UPI00371594E1